MSEIAKRISIALVAAVCSLGAAQTALSQTSKLVIQGGSPVPYLGFLPVYVAQGAGLFAEEGLEASINYAANAGMSVQLVAAGNGDIAISTFEPVIQGREKGIGTKLFAQLNRSLLYYVAVPAGSPVQSAADLAGKKIGVSNLGSSAQPVAKSLLDIAGVKHSDATFLPVGVGSQAQAALNSGQVEALALWDGIYFAMERGGADFRYIYHPQLKDFGNLGITMSDKADDALKEKLCAAGRAIAKGVIFILENPEAAVPMYWKANATARGTGDEAKAFADTLTEIRKFAATLGTGVGADGRVGSFDGERFATYVSMLKEQGYISQLPEVEDVSTDAMIDCINAFDVEAVRTAARNWK